MLRFREDVIALDKTGVMINLVQYPVKKKLAGEDGNEGRMKNVARPSLPSSKNPD
jgi:hypothetical protein